MAFWVVAALLVAVVHQRIDAPRRVAWSSKWRDGDGAAFIKPAARKPRRSGTPVRTTQVLLCIATEIAVTTISGFARVRLTGLPANGESVRSHRLILAPALFIRSRE
jgi:hypothetical protein